MCEWLHFCTYGTMCMLTECMFVRSFVHLSRNVRLCTIMDLRAPIFEHICMLARYIRRLIVARVRRHGGLYQSPRYQGMSGWTYLCKLEARNFLAAIGWPNRMCISNIFGALVSLHRSNGVQRCYAMRHCVRMYGCMSVTKCHREQPARRTNFGTHVHVEK